MAEKDASEKILESYNEVFADIVNVLLFNGTEIVKPEELEEQSPRAAYKADGKIREIERDVAKRWTKQNIHIACLGLENQTKVDRDMPMRIIAYDGAEYRAALNRKPPERYPVVTLVLYFGDGHWDGPLRLLDCFSVPEAFRPYVNDYPIHLFEIAYLTDEQVRLFKSDFRIVAEYFTQKRQNRDYQPEDITLVHVQEVLQLLSVMTGDHRFEDVFSDREEGGPKNMCEILDRIENRGIAKGIALGEARGIAMGEARGEARGIALGEARGEARGMARMADALRLMGLSEAQIQEALRRSREKTD